MRVALLAHSARFGDAVGNQVAARAAFFRERAADVRVYVESDARLHDELLPFTQTVVTDPEREAVISDLTQSDLIVVEYSQAYRLLEVLPCVAGRGPRILFDYHGVTPPKFWRGAAEALREGQKRRGLVWFADEAVVHSEFMQRELCEATGYPAQRVHLLPLWFDQTRLKTAKAARLRKTLGLTNERLVLFVGRLAPNKRVPVLLDAVARLKDEQPAIHVAIVGDAGDVYRAELKHCEELADSLGIAERVHFLGQVDDKELAGAYRSADLFVMPSVHEGCCIPVLEAMAAGVPVIAARAAALPETIGNAGLTFTADDPDDLAKQICRVFTPTSNLAQRRKDAKELGPALRLGVFARDLKGGAESSLRLIAKVLAEFGHHIELLTSLPQNPASFDAIITGPYCNDDSAKLAQVS